MLNLPVKRPLAVLAVFVVAIIGGLISLRRLPVSLMPDVSAPRLTVVTEFEGASPQDVGNLVTRPLEDAIGTISGVTKVLSTSRRGHSAIEILFRPGVNIDFAAADVREQIDLVTGRLPQGVSVPAIERHNPGDYPIVNVVLHGGDSVFDLIMYSEPLQRELSRLPGVAQVDIMGETTREILVAADPGKLHSHAISLEQIARAFHHTNLSFNLGELEEEGREYQIRGVGEFKSIDDIENVVVSLREGIPTSISQIATVHSSVYEDDIIARLGGERVLVFQIRQLQEANLVQLTREIEQRVGQLKEIYLPEGLDLTLLSRQSEFIERALDSVYSAVFIGSILAFLVILFFLGNFRDSLIICTAIPVSIISTFIFLYSTGLSLNLMSLGGLALGAGMLIDNAIVVLESVNRHHKDSSEQDSDAAIVRGVREVASAIFASTLTTVAVFFPIVFMENFAARMFEVLAVVVAVSMFVSLGVAFFLIPALVSLYYNLRSSGSWLFEEPDLSQDESLGLIRRLYKLLWAGIYPIAYFFKNTVEICSLRVNKTVEKFAGFIIDKVQKGWHYRRVICLAVMIVLLLFGYLIYTQLAVGIFPPIDSSNFMMFVEFPDGYPLERTDNEALVLQELLAGETAIRDYIVFTGHEMLPGDIRDNFITIQGDLYPAWERSETVDELLNRISLKLEELFPVTVSHQIAFGDVGIEAGDIPEPVEIKVRGYDIEILDSLSSEVENILRQNPALTNIQVDFERRQPEFEIEIDRDATTRHGLSVHQVAEEIQAALSGKVPTSFKERGEEIDIRVTLQRPAHVSIDFLTEIPLLTPFGYVTTLSRVADIYRQPSVPWVKHEDSMRTVTVSADILDPRTEMIFSAVKNRFADFPSPDGFYVDVLGAFPVLQEMNREIMWIALLSILLVYMTMAGQFNRFLPPFVVMFSVPMAFVGALLFMFITRIEISVVSTMGFIVLTGIVVNNAILIVDYTLQYWGKLSLKEACCKAVEIRIRPVFMTTLTTIFALIPLLLSGGEAGALQRPLAITVTGGLLFGTILILYFIPLLMGVFLREDMR